MGIQCRILSIILVLSFVFGLPAQAIQMTGTGSADHAMTIDGLAPVEDCQHCDMGLTVDMAACHGLCFAMPILPADGAPNPVSMGSTLLRARASSAAEGLTLPPDAAPPKAPFII